MGFILAKQDGNFRFEEVLERELYMYFFSLIVGNEIIGE